MSLSRRVFVRRSGLALLALGLPPAFITRSLLAATGGASGRKTLVCVFQRGAVDGLAMIPPFGEQAYYAGRRATAIAAPRRGAPDAALELDGFFGMHPAMAPLHDLYGKGELGVVHAVGSPHPTRSHFDAQDFMETGTPGVKSTRDGWLNRVLGTTGTGCAHCDGRTLEDAAAHAADHASGQVAMASVPALRGVALTPALPKALAGTHPALSIPDLAAFGVNGDDAVERAFRRLYAAEGDAVVGEAADDAFEAARILRQADPLAYRPAEGATYPPGAFGRSMQQIAQLIKADVGVEIAFTDIGGWDTHQAQGGASGQLARRLQELAAGIRAFHDDLGDRMEDVLVLTMSEFGRTVRENGSGGTDHGHANCMMALGGSVRGGRVLGPWPGLEREQLHEGRDLALTTDFRDVFSEVVAGHLGASRLAEIFPGHPVDRGRWRGLLG